MPIVSASETWIASPLPPVSICVSPTTGYVGLSHLERLGWKTRRLEAILIEHGAPPASVDAVTRALRKEGVIPVTGRGVNASDITHNESAWIMSVVAGAQFAARAAFHLARLNNLCRPASESRNAAEFVFALQVILSSPERAASIREIRIAQNLNLARIAYKDRSRRALRTPERRAMGRSR